MNTSAIPTSVPTSTGAILRSQQSEAASPDAPFKQILTREVIDRHSAENTKATTKEAKRADKPAERNNAESAVKTSSAPTKERDPKDSGNVSEPENNSGTEQLLIMAAQFSPVTIATVTQAIAADPNTAITEALMVTEAGLKAMEAKPSLAIVNIDSNADQTTLKIAAFDTALSASAEKNQAQNASDKSALLGTTLPQGQASEKIQDAASMLASANGIADKTQDIRPDLSASIAPLQQAIAHIGQASLGHVTDRITTQVGTPAWNQSIGQKLVWMIGDEQQSASLTLNPPDLGPLQVVLSVSSTQANASFYSSQPEVRQALEAALPKLREMLGDAGIQLGQANVSAGNPQQQGSYGEQQASARGLSHSSDSAVLPATRVTNSARIVRDGLIDTFA